MAGDDALKAMTRRFADTISALLEIQRMPVPVWTTTEEDADELVAAWAIDLPSGARYIVWLCWVEQEFILVLESLGLDEFPTSPTPWQRRLLAVIGYCFYEEIQVVWVPEWPGIEGMRAALKD
jgi:hypothetical protein